MIRSKKNVDKKNLNNNDKYVKLTTDEQERFLREMENNNIELDQLMDKLMKEKEFAREEEIENIKKSQNEKEKTSNKTDYNKGRKNLPSGF
jgi:isochorismate hydrolase